MNQEFNVWKIRQDFPMLRQLMHGRPFVYLDSAATAQKPQIVINTISDFYTTCYATVNRSVYDFASKASAHYNIVRQKVKRFLNAAYVEEIIFTKSTTESLNLVAHCLSKLCLQPGDEVLISEMEHHSNIVPWYMCCREKGAYLKVIPVNESGELIFEEFQKLLSDKTKIVSIVHMSNVLGTVNPIAEIVKEAHAKGAKVVVDGAQSAPHMLIDVQNLGVDFYAFSAHKMYGPTGLGILYGKRSLLEIMPPYQGGGDMVDEVAFDKITYQEPPLKFEAGTPMIAEVMGLGAALDYIEAIDQKLIATWEKDLLEYTTQRLVQIKGLKIIGISQQKGPILSFSIVGFHPLDLATLLGLRGIAIRTGHLCAQPILKRYHLSSLLRISLAFYNTFEEIDLFIHALKEALLLLKPEISY
ncbi:MAG: aminotransferase class V-fold PLP-dependent enzyme [Candidatus Rhabdochlamydia sp.]|nr:cysteine desulfurase / selenocysteine lyase [Chlamydiota bacterium]